jgi:hypothetical protein
LFVFQLRQLDFISSFSLNREVNRTHSMVVKSALRDCRIL